MTSDQAPGAGGMSELPELEPMVCHTCGDEFGPETAHLCSCDDEDPTAGFTYVIERDDTWH